MMQSVTITSTRYHTRYHIFTPSLTWLGYNATFYDNFNVLPYKFSMVWGYFQRINTHCRQIYKKNISMLKKPAARNNALQIAQNQANIRENIYVCLSMLAEFSNVW